MPGFVTLGPGTNHEVAARRYLDFHGVDQAGLSFAGSSAAAVAMLRDGTADWYILCAVHPSTPEVVGQFHSGIFVVDTFIAPSKPLAILTQADVAHPRSIGLFTPVSGYADVSAWPERVAITDGSLVEVGEALLARRFDSALVYAELADQHPGRFRVDAAVESPDDAWLVLGRTRAAGRDGLIASPAGAVARALTGSPRLA